MEILQKNLEEVKELYLPEIQKLNKKDFASRVFSLSFLNITTKDVAFAH